MGCTASTLYVNLIKTMELKNLNQENVIKFQISLLFIVLMHTLMWTF